MTLKVIPWTWRDGSVHLEMRLTSFPSDDGEILTHLDGDGRFVTACGQPWWGKLSASGIGRTGGVTCPDCRRLLSSMTFEGTVQT